jgi:hypothetical protein
MVTNSGTKQLKRMMQMLSVADIRAKLISQKSLAGEPSREHGSAYGKICIATGRSPPGGFSTAEAKEEQRAKKTQLQAEGRSAQQKSASTQGKGTSKDANQTAEDRPVAERDETNETDSTAQEAKKNIGPNGNESSTVKKKRGRRSSIISSACAPFLTILLGSMRRPNSWVNRVPRCARNRLR